MENYILVKNARFNIRILPQNHGFEFSIPVHSYPDASFEMTSCGCPHRWRKVADQWPIYRNKYRRLAGITMRLSGEAFLGKLSSSSTTSKFILIDCLLRTLRDRRDPILIAKTSFERVCIRAKRSVFRENFRSMPASLDSPPFPGASSLASLLCWCSFL